MGKKASAFVCTALVLCLTGCATAPKMSWVRTDGQRMAADPVLAQQFDIDRTICSGEMQKANVSGVTFANGGIAGSVAAANRSAAVGQVGQGCMAEKGYVSVKEEEAEQKAEEFAMIAAEKKRREAALAAPANSPQKKQRAPAVTTAQAAH